MMRAPVTNSYARPYDAERPAPYVMPKQASYAPEIYVTHMERAPAAKRTMSIEADKAKYISAITDLGYDAKDIEKLGEISIDKLGYSPEVAEILGEGYMKNRFIILDSRQGSLGAIKPSYSFTEEVADVAYGKIGKHIDILSRGEPIVADLNVAYDRQKGGFRINLAFDTPSRNIKRLNDVRGKVRCINSQVMLDKGRLGGIVNEVRELREIYGDLKQFDNITNNVELSVSSFKLDCANYEEYFFSKGPLAVSFGKSSESLGLTVIDGNDKKAVKKALYEAGFLTMDKASIEGKIDKMERSSLIKKYGDTAEKIWSSKKKDLFGYYASLREASSFLDKEWSKMKALFENGRKPSIDEIDMEFLIPANEPFIGELMERVFGQQRLSATKPSKLHVIQVETAMSNDPIDQVLSKHSPNSYTTDRDYRTSLID